MEKTDVGGGRQPFGTEQCAHLPRDAGGTTPLSSVVYVPQVYQRDLIYPHGDHGLGLGIRSYGGLRLTPCARIRRVGLVMDSVSSRSKGTRLGVKRQGVLFVARSGCQGLPGAAIDAAGTVGATGEPATKARRLPPVASTQAHAARGEPAS